MKLSVSIFFKNNFKFFLLIPKNEIEAYLYDVIHLYGAEKKLEKLFCLFFNIQIYI